MENAAYVDGELYERYDRGKDGDVMRELMNEERIEAAHKWSVESSFHDGGFYPETLDAVEQNYDVFEH